MIKIQIVTAGTPSLAERGYHAKTRRRKALGISLTLNPNPNLTLNPNHGREVPHPAGVSERIGEHRS